MATILPFLRDGVFFRDSVFEPHDIKAMSLAFNDVCEVLKLQDDGPAKEVMAKRIIDLARRGERSPTRLRDRVLHEAGLAEYAPDTTKPIRHSQQATQHRTPSVGRRPPEVTIKASPTPTG
jgi:hypothetical protein